MANYTDERLLELYATLEAGAALRRVQLELMKRGL